MSVAGVAQMAKKQSVCFVAVDDDVDYVELVGVLLDEVVHRDAEVAECLLPRLEHSRHDTRPYGRDADAGEFVSHGLLEAGCDEFVKRLL